MRATETLCPFCATALPEAGPARPMPTKRMSRAASYALGVATLAATAAGCGGGTTGTDAGGSDMSTTDSGGGSDAATDSGGGSDLGIDGPLAMYGAPPDLGARDTGVDGPIAAYGGPPVDLGPDFGGAPAYGIAPPPDGGNDGGGPAPAYGLPGV